MKTIQVQVAHGRMFAALTEIAHTKEEPMILHIYHQNCLRAGQIANEESGDTWKLTGTEQELIQWAKERLMVRYDKRAGGRGDEDMWKCAKNVLRYFNEELPEYDEATGAYVFAVPEEEEE